MPAVTTPHQPGRATRQTRAGSLVPALAPLAVLPALAAATRSVLPPWATMWLLALALYFGFKWLTLWRAPGGPLRAGLLWALGYLLAWPGMDPGPFLVEGTAPSRPSARDWAAAGLRILAGSLLLWVLLPRLEDLPGYLRGWVGMAGAVLLLHFGGFHLLALAWRRAGIDAEPLMRRPLASRSLAEFWGRRWNTAFRQLAHALFYRPLARAFGPAWGTLAGFLVSGLIHDLVISYPARGGYGLPTLYFLVQGGGLLVERSAALRPHLRSGGPAARAWTWLVVAGPAVLLFHPRFVERVILPFLDVLGATS